ncbi:MAG: RluA family pseudouridine synthase [Ignavibacteria bacterium]|jgi:23S rRNA pseudouridine1911/1915/1917 synthase|nr:RluA family pseudouridine synthase [Ignavibacteria bacterium]MCU7502397.1 RluA family pseudouridine synthase [Ignavibacteria bacterium]MCU7515038.1 RluA family pseudouridine synthase [Ignavibacteria bacterium]
MTNLISEKKIRFEVPPGKKKERVDVYLTNLIENATRSKIQKLLEAGLVLVNGSAVRANYKVSPQDVVDVRIPISPRPENAMPEEIPLDIVYEDEYLLIVNKPAGMVAHPAYANYTGTLVNALLHHSRTLSNLNEPGRPGIVHRIDKDTSGILVVAKDDVTHAKLAAQFSKHTIEREYWAVVWGILKEKQGVIEKNIARSKSDRKKYAVSETEGKTAITYYTVLEEFEFASLIKLNLKTGRTHQIRVHMSSINHPIFGDVTYGGNKIVYGYALPKMKSRIDNLLEIMPRQALHAKTLGFYHPHTGEFVRFDSPLPEDFRLLLEKLRPGEK